MDTVINLNNEPMLREAFEYAHVHNNTALIDRRTKWGNRFRIGPDGDRAQVIARYRAGMWLACWCDPLPCHGHVLARAAAWAAARIQSRRPA